MMEHHIFNKIKNFFRTSLRKDARLKEFMDDIKINEVSLKDNTYNRGMRDEWL